MFERFTQEGLQVLAFARLAALEKGDDVVSPEDLLLGLVGATPEAVLAGLPPGASLNVLRERLQGVGLQGPKYPLAAELPFSAMTKDIIRRAASEADTLHHSSICPEHLVLALFVQQGTHAQVLLASLGLERGLVEKRLDLKCPKATDAP